MTNQTKICRVCGKEYEACHSVRTGAKVFNWREFACSPECGAKYLRMVESARRKTEPERTKRTARRKVLEQEAMSILGVPTAEGPAVEENPNPEGVE